jgi:HAE1 family hydrophobic/amphiphilic exporter-1/multidrug efflux pump
MSKFFIHRPVFAIVISLVILIAGGLAMTALPVAQYPQISPPTVEVEINFPGANAETVEKSIASAVEQEVNGAENMIYFSSKSTSDGRYVLTCTFNVGTNLDLANVDINNRVNKAQPKLPPEAIAAGISIKKKSPDMLVVLSLHSPDGTYDDLFLSNYASINLVDPLARVPGVGSTMIIGQRDYSMRFWVRPDRLAGLGITAGDLSNAVKEQNLVAPAGAVGQPPAKAGTEFQLAVNVKGRLETPEEFENIIVRTLPDGSILRMKDLSRAEMAGKTYTSFGRLDGKPATVVIVYQLPGANAIATVDGIQRLLEEKRAGLPPGLVCDVSLDTTEFVRVGIHEVVLALRDAIILVLIVVFVFLGNVRATFIPMLAVPVALVGTFAGFSALGFSINTLTLFGLVLAVGIVVDDAIVVVEAVEHHIQHGLAPLAATEKAMDEVQGPVIAIALILCAVFVPVTFMGGITGQLYKQFAVTLAISVVLSAVVALSLTPALCRMMLKPRKEMGGPVGWFLRGFNGIFDRVTAGYTATVRRMLRFLVIGFALLGGIYAGAGGLGATLPKGFVPDQDQGYYFAVLQLPDGASMERTDALAKRGEEFLKTIPGVKGVVTMGGLNLLTNAYTSNNLTFIVLLKDWGERHAPEEKIQAMMARTLREFRGYPEAVAIVFMPPPINGLGNAGGFQFELQDRAGRTPDELMATSAAFVAEASKRPELAGLFSSFRSTIPQVKLDLDRDKARTLGVPVNEAFQVLQICLGGLQVNDFNLFGRTYKVMIQAEPEFRASPENIANLYVRSGAGDMIPMGTLSTTGSMIGPDLLQRYNMFRCAEISGVPAPGYSSGQAIAAMEDVARVALPQGYGFEWTGMAYQEKAAGGGQAVILLLGLVFVFLFLAAQYESWAIPFSVILGIPMCALGAFLACMIRGLPNDTYVQIGLVMLIGLAAKNAILIVEFAVMKMKEGVPLLDATLEGAKLRFRPILMTSFAFILGVIPLVIAHGAGAEARIAMGTAVFGGMIAATVLGVFIIPVLFYAVMRAVERLGGGPKAAPAAAPAPAAEHHA